MTMLRRSFLLALACIWVLLCPTTARDYQAPKLQTRTLSEHGGARSKTLGTIPERNDEPESASENPVDNVPGRSNTPQPRRAYRHRSRQSSHYHRADHDHSPPEDRPSDAPPLHPLTKENVEFVTAREKELFDKKVGINPKHHEEKSLAISGHPKPGSDPEHTAHTPSMPFSTVMKHNKKYNQDLFPFKIPTTDKSMSTDQVIKGFNAALQASRRLERTKHLPIGKTAKVEQSGEHQEKLSPKGVSSHLSREEILEFDMRHRNLGRPRSSKGGTPQETEAPREPSSSTHTSLLTHHQEEAEKGRPDTGNQPASSSGHKAGTRPSPFQQNPRHKRRGLKGQSTGISDAGVSAKLWRRSLPGLESRTWPDGKLAHGAKRADAQRMLKRSLWKRAGMHTAPEKVAALDGEAPSALMRRGPTGDGQDHRGNGASSSNEKAGRPAPDEKGPPFGRPQRGNGRGPLPSPGHRDSRGLFEDRSRHNGHPPPSQDQRSPPGSPNSDSSPLGRKRKPENHGQAPMQANPYRPEDRAPQKHKPPLPESRVNLGQRPKGKGPLPADAGSAPQRSQELDTSSLKKVWAERQAAGPKKPGSPPAPHPPRKEVQSPEKPRSPPAPQSPRKEAQSPDKPGLLDSGRSTHAPSEHRPEPVKPKSWHGYDSSGDSIHSQSKGKPHDSLSKLSPANHPAKLKVDAHPTAPWQGQRVEHPKGHWRYPGTEGVEKDLAQVKDPHMRTEMLKHPTFWRYQPVPPELQHQWSVVNTDTITDPARHHKITLASTHSKNSSDGKDKSNSIRGANVNHNNHNSQHGSFSDMSLSSIVSDPRRKRGNNESAKTHESVSLNMHPKKPNGASFNRGGHNFVKGSRDSVYRDTFGLNNGNHDKSKHDRSRYNGGHPNHSPGGRADTARHEHAKSFEKLASDKHRAEHTKTMDEHTKTLEETNRHLAEKNEIKRGRAALDERILREATEKRAGRRGMARGVGIGLGAAAGGLGAAVGFTALGDKLGMEHPAPRILDQLHGHQSQPRGSQGQIGPNPGATPTSTSATTPTPTPPPTPSPPPWTQPGYQGPSP